MNELSPGMVVSFVCYTPTLPDERWMDGWFMVVWNDDTERSVGKWCFCGGELLTWNNISELVYNMDAWYMVME